MNPSAYIIFLIDDQYYAIPVDRIKQVIRSVQLTYLHEAPELLQGLFNMSGEIVPVINIRKQFKLAAKDITPSDRIIIISTPSHIIAFIVDHIESIIELPETDITPSADIFPKMEDYIIGTAKYNGRMALIYDIDYLFPQQELEKITSHLNCAKEIA